ncbi:GNAT family N-acetyltransferase [Actinoplanes sp. NPDC051513]|uniref:GNAT family N-acetyltransferase n=1 Tax=Actinoplanes sp. NPDC051513 TaxID=3363908 RepID=UPI0037ADE821
MDELVVRHAGVEDRGRITELLLRSWGSTIVVAHGVRYDAADLPALLAERANRVAGLLTYASGVDGLEVVTLDAVERNAGVGTALLDAAAQVASGKGMGRVWLITTNDNVDALRFYQRRGMRIVGIEPGAVDESRRLKPSIPVVGHYGIEIHDEIILERRLPPG